MLHPKLRGHASQVRLAIVQHGDYREALHIVTANQPEPYSGLRYSVRCLEKLIGHHAHLLISLNAPHYHIRRPGGELIGMPTDPRIPRMPGKLRIAFWRRRILPRIHDFQPTHLLIRTGADQRTRVLLGYCLSRQLPSLVLFANQFPQDVHPQLIKAINSPLVHRAGNHRQPATQSMIDAGVRADKCVAYDCPAQDHRTPEAFTPKSRDPADPVKLIFAGNVTWKKGIADLVDAVHLLARDRWFNVPISLHILGDGPDFKPLQTRIQALPPGLVTMTGRLANRQVFSAMREATFVCVPSHHRFDEGMPQTLTEALAARTPVIASDHPILTRTFADGSGMRFAPEQSPEALAKLIRELANDPEQYSQLSRSTAAAWHAVQCPTTMGDLLDDWQNATMPVRT